MIGRRTRLRGFTLVELMVVILIISLLIAILLPALARARAYARMAACASNMRQFGIGVTNYAVERDDKMPPVDHNYWSYLANYIGEASGGRFESGAGSDLFRCGADAYIADAPGNSSVTYPNPHGGGVIYPLAGRGAKEAYSYAANYAATVHIDPDVHVELDGSNDVFTPFTYDATGRVRRLGNTAPDTILFIESHGECVGDLSEFDAGQTVNLGFEEGVVNRLMLNVSNPALLGGGDLSDTPSWHMRPAIQDYNDTANSLTLNALTRKFTKGQGNNNVLTHHWLLTMVETGTSYDDAFHIGLVNVLFSDGSVSNQDVLVLGKTSVGADSRWTRQRD